MLPEFLQFNFIKISFKCFFNILRRNTQFFLKSNFSKNIKKRLEVYKNVINCFTFTTTRYLCLCWYPSVEVHLAGEVSPALGLHAYSRQPLEGDRGLEATTTRTIPDRHATLASKIQTLTLLNICLLRINLMRDWHTYY